MLNIHRYLFLMVALLLTPVARSVEDEHDHDSPPHAEHSSDESHDHHANEIKLSAEAIKIAKIRVEPAGKQSLDAVYMAPARMAFNAEAVAHVGSLVTGRVVEIKARIGDQLQQGDELLVLESTELGQAQSDYLQRRTELNVAEAAVEPAKEAYERARRLYEESQGIALSEVQKRRSEFNTAEGNHLIAKSATDAALNKLLLFGMSKERIKEIEKSSSLDPYYSVRAPLTGQVIEREVTKGELVHPEKERLFVIANTQTLWVLTDVPESRLASLKEGSTARVSLSAIPGKAFEGTVAQIAPVLNADTRTGRCRIDLPNSDGVLRPGMFATVELVAGSSDGAVAVVVPDEAVQTVEGKPVVFVPVEGEENTFTTRQITVAQRSSGKVAIASGLTEGEPVVVSGAFLLKAELGKGEAGHEH